MEAVRKTRRGLRSRDLLHRRHSRSRRATSIRSTYYVGWRRSWRRMGAHILAHQGHGGAVQALRRREAGEGAARGDRHSDPLPHARHQRHQRGIDPEGVGRGRATSPTRAIASMSGTTSQPNLNSIVAALAHTRARHRARSRRARITCADYWEIGPHLLRAVRHRSEVRHRRGLPARDARRAVHEPARSRPRRWASAQRWPEIARTYADVNMAFGDIVKVTPSSKVVGDMAIFLVSHGMTMEEFEALGPGPHADAAQLGRRHVLGIARASRTAAGRRSCRRSFCAAQKPPKPAVRASICRRSISKQTAADAREEDRPRARRTTTC